MLNVVIIIKYQIDNSILVRRLFHAPDGAVVIAGMFAVQFVSARV